MRFRTTLLAAVVAASSLAGPVFAEAIASVVRVDAGATVVRNGRALALERRAGIEQGDVIRTDATGTVQLLFDDRTRIAVGPNSEFRVDEYRDAGGGKASRVALDALGGTFRFLSGRSPSEVYEIKTPTATMAVRGTVFDFVVAGRETTNLATFEGQVQICESGRRCAFVSGGCTTVTVRPRQGVATLPTKDEKLLLLATEFPFVLSQENLSLQFRTRTWTCGDVKSALPTTPAAIQERGNIHRDSGAEDGGYSEIGDERG